MFLLALYLIHLPPLRVEVVVHMMRGEDLCAHPQHSVRVRLASNYPLYEGVLGSQVLGFQQVNPYYTLRRREGDQGMSQIEEKKEELGLI